MPERSSSSAAAGSRMPERSWLSGMVGIVDAPALMGEPSGQMLDDPPFMAHASASLLDANPSTAAPTSHPRAEPAA